MKPLLLKFQLCWVVNNDGKEKYRKVVIFTFILIFETYLLQEFPLFLLGNITHYSLDTI